MEDQARLGLSPEPGHVYYPLAILPTAAEQSFDWQLQLLMDRKRKLALNLLAAPTFTKDDYDGLISGIQRRATAA